MYKNNNKKPCKNKLKLERMRYKPMVYETLYNSEGETANLSPS